MDILIYCCIAPLFITFIVIILTYFSIANKLRNINSKDIQGFLESFSNKPPKEKTRNPSKANKEENIFDYEDAEYTEVED